MTVAEYHVASFIVTTRADAADEVDQRLSAIPEVEVHVREGGKLVVTAEAAGRGELASLADTINEVEGVIATAPVYHEYAPIEELES